MKNTKFWAILQVFVIFIGIFGLPLAVSSLMDRTVIKSTGEISANVTASSGSAKDIQAAVDVVVAFGGDRVYIPAGTFNFCEPGETWVTVQVPAGISIYGSPTERDVEGQVIEYKTILQVTHEAVSGNPPASVLFFYVTGNNQPDERSRFTDLKLVGYREFNNTSPTWYTGIKFWNCQNFRVDHCYFKHITADCITAEGSASGSQMGVIDHCYFINDYGFVEWWIFDCTVGYGVSVHRFGTTEWEPIDTVLGGYHRYTVFIEDCYFSRWRHCYSANDGAHIVFRHNTVEYDSNVGSLDGHGTYNNVGTRAMEIYENEIIDPVNNFASAKWNSTTPDNGLTAYGINWRGGSGVVFNNTIRNYHLGIYFIDEGSVEKCWPHDVWIWDNTWTNVGHPIAVYTNHYPEGETTEGEDYFLYAKSGYSPYPYPHPLTTN